MKGCYKMLVCALILAGCAASTGPGSKVWYEKRMAELDTAFQNKEITKAEYLQLKNEADRIRAGTTSDDTPRASFGVFTGF